MTYSNNILALDIGTSSVRAILFDSSARPVTTSAGVVIEAQVKYEQTTTADGGVEVDAEHLLSIAASCLSRVLTRVRRANTHISGVGISCFWHSLVGVDSNNRAVTPVYSWADTRAGKYVPQLRDLFDNDTYHKITGAELHPCFWPAKLIWQRTENPELFKRSAKWLGFAEYLFLRLFGSGPSSVSMASGTGLFNQQTADWDQSVLDALKIDRALLPDVTGFTPTTGISDEFRGALAQLADVPWFPAVGDGACSNIGSGGVDDTRIVLNIGTSAAMRIVVDASKGEPLGIRKGLFCYRVDEHHAIIGGAFANGGNVYAWLKDVLQWHDDTLFVKKVAQIKPDSHGLTVLPFWAGERSPGWRPDARASIHGMNLHTNSADIVRATLESIAYSFDEIRQSLTSQFDNARQIVVSGGAVAASPLLAQIICDVFGVRLVTSKVAEASSRGAALIGLQGIGAIKSWTDLPVELGAIYKPSATRHELYVDGRKRFQEYYDREDTQALSKSLKVIT